MPARATPTFAAKSSLCRYIDRDQRRGRFKDRADHGAFMLNPEEDHLSVNSLEVEPEQQIAEYYASVWGHEDRKVPICVHTIFEYNDSGKKAGCSIWFNQLDSRWQFAETNGTPAAAYRHRPVFRKPDFPYESRSHCGVEFVRALSDLKQRQFARRLAKRKIRIVQIDLN